MTYTTKDGITLTAYSSLYLDWGISITGPKGDSLYNCPHALSSESYGSKPSAKFDHWDEAERASFEGDDEAFEPWDEADWASALEDEADELIEAFVGEDAP